MSEPTPSPTLITRRGFLNTAAIASAAIAAAPLAGCAAPGPAIVTTPPPTPSPKPTPAATQPIKKLNVAIVGVGGRGFDHVREISPIPNANVVALCDVDVNNLVQAARTITTAAIFVDFRDMLQMPGLDAVVVATPDHAHAVITAAALRAGKHVYCEKPLAHTIHEVRAITELAAQTKLVTQMGIQIHSMDNYRRVVELIQSNAIGPVREVHIWNNRNTAPINPAESAPPPSLNYDLWLGPVPARPYHPDFHPFNWRRRWAFGSGMLGDIGCHLMDVVFWALDLKYPTRIQSEGSPFSEDITTEWIVAHYEFPMPTGEPLKLTWYDPPKTPPALASWKLEPPLTAEGVMFIGTEGMLCTNYDRHVLLPTEKFKSFTPPPARIPSSPGHQRQWVDACLKNDPAAPSVPFSYAGPLTETALLGTLAFRAQKPLDWDGKTMRFPKSPEAEKLLEYSYRPGWKL